MPPRVTQVLCAAIAADAAGELAAVLRAVLFEAAVLFAATDSAGAAAIFAVDGVAADAACIDALAAGAPVSFASNSFTWVRAVSSGASAIACLRVAAASSGLFSCAYAIPML